MNKKYNETMVVENGKMIYAISLKEKSNRENNFIMIKNGEIYFTGDRWYNQGSFDFNNETHRIAKEIFVSQLQVDIKRRVLELKQLEEIFKDLNLSECLSDIIPNSARMLTEVKEEMKKQLDNKIISINSQLDNKIDSKIEEQVKPIARKKKKIKTEAEE